MGYASVRPTFSTRIRALYRVWLGGTFDCVAIIPVVTTMPGSPTTRLISRLSRPLSWMRTVRSHSINLMPTPSPKNSDPDPNISIANGVRGGVRSQDKGLRLPVQQPTTTKTTSRHGRRGQIRFGRMWLRSLAAVDHFRWPFDDILRRGAPRLRPHGVIFFEDPIARGSSPLLPDLAARCLRPCRPRQVSIETLFGNKMGVGTVGWRGNETEHKLRQKTTEVKPHPCTGLDEGGENHCNRAAAPT